MEAARARRRAAIGDPRKAPLVREPTQKLGTKVLTGFIDWLRREGVTVDVGLLFASSALADALIEAYGLVLFRSNVPLYVYLNVVTASQRLAVGLRRGLPRAWDFAKRWETLEPYDRRAPLPLPLCKAMVSLGLLLGWTRWALVLYAAFKAPMRIGELLNAVRGQLVLPEDMWRRSADRAYVYLHNPKSGLRGGARHQFASLRCPLLIAALERVFGSAPDDERLYPFQPAAFRARWDHVLGLLRIPRELNLRPGGIRGGGCVAMHVDEVPMTDIQWAMRVQSLKTLEHYLQEVGACVSLRKAPAEAKRKVQALELMLEILLEQLARKP